MEDVTINISRLRLHIFKHAKQNTDKNLRLLVWFALSESMRVMAIVQMALVVSQVVVVVIEFSSYQKLNDLFSLNVFVCFYFYEKQRLEPGWKDLQNQQFL